MITDVGIRADSLVRCQPRRNTEIPMYVIGFPYPRWEALLKTWPHSLTLHQLNIFAEIAREGSFTRAAEALALSEPSVSEQIKLLEGVLGVRLFDRGSGKPIQITEAGQRLKATCADVFQLLDRTAQDLEVLTRAKEDVRFGSTGDFCDRLLPGAYASFTRQAPDVTVTVEIASREHLLDALARGRLDLVVVDGPVDEPELVAVTLAGNDLVLIGPAGYAMPPDVAGHIEDFARDPLVKAGPIWVSATKLTKRLVEWHLASPVAWDADEVEARINLVSSGLGIAAVPFYRTVAGIASGNLVPVQVHGFPLHFEWAIVARVGELPGPARAFKAHLLNHRGELEAMCICPAVGPALPNQVGANSDRKQIRRDLRHRLRDRRQALANEAHFQVTDR